MKRLFKLFIVLIVPLSGFANGFPRDRLIWDGDTITVFGSPRGLLELRSDMHLLRPELFRLDETGSDPGCLSGYTAEWKVIDNVIYLTNVYCVSYLHGRVHADLETVFGDEYEDGRVKATWITDQVLIPGGELIHYIDHAHRYYETELLLIFNNGKLIEQKEYESKSYKSVFAENPDSLRHFIYSNIDWKKIPDLKDEDVRVFFKIVSGETLKPEEIYILRGSDHEVLNQEALRVVNQIPEWNVYYSRGKFHRIQWTVQVRFNEQKRLEYAR